MRTQAVHTGSGQLAAPLGIHTPKPIKKAYEQRPEAVQAWLDGQSPAIEKRAKAEGAEIHWDDETAVINTDVCGRSYAPAGHTHVAYAVGGMRQKPSMIATVTNQGKTRWMIIDEAFNADKLIEFLDALIRDADKKVFVILDNLRVHHSKLVKAWVAERKDRVPRRFVWNLTARIHRSGARWGLWATRQSELSTNPPGGAFC